MKGLESMEPTVKKRVDKYRASLTKLFEEIRAWLKDTGFSSEQTDIQVTEPRTGSYTVPMLTILDQTGKTLAEVRPVGAWIIGAEGRLDIRGHLNNEVLAYWEKGAPEIQISESEEKIGYRPGSRLFRGADKEGWYWIEDKMRGKALPLDKELFLDLVSEVQPL